MIVSNDEENNLLQDEEANQLGRGKGSTSGGGLSNPGGQVGSPASSSANAASGGFVNLEDYLRANNEQLGRYGQMARDDFSGLKNENKDMLDTVNPDLQQVRPEYSYLPGAALKRSVDELLPGEGYEKGYYNENRLPESGRKDKAEGLEKRGKEYWVSDAEAENYNNRLKELKNYYTGKRNEGYQKDADELVKKANATSYNKTLTENPFLSQDEAAITGRAKDAQAKAKNMASEDYWSGRVGYDQENGYGNALDSFLAYQGGGQEAQRLAQGFDGLENKLREKLNLRKGELGKKEKFEEYAGQVESLRNKAKEAMSLEDIFKMRNVDGFGPPETAADFLNVPGPVGSAAEYYSPTTNPAGNKKQKIYRFGQPPMSGQAGAEDALWRAKLNGWGGF